jgi:ethanolamine permease
MGVGEALKVMLVIAAIAVAGLVLYLVGAIPAFDSGNLLDIAPTDAAGASSFLPYGVIGIWAAFPFAIWFFLAVECVPLASEEARDPARALPRGIVAAMGVLLVLAVLMLVFTSGTGGSEAMSASGNPPVEALEVAGSSSTLTEIVNYAGLFGLVASFFSIIYAYSRQTFALSRAGYLPRVLSVTNGRKAPMLALLVPGAIGFVLSLTGQGAMLLNMAVFGATVSYVLMMVSHIVLRRREPDLPRPYRTPGGVATTGVALVLAAAAVVATFLVDVQAALWTLGAYAVFLAYFALYSRHHLVASAPEEEFELLAAADEDVR